MKTTPLPSKESWVVVKQATRYLISSHGRITGVSGKLLKTNAPSGRYPRVSLCTHVGKTQNFTVHRLVAFHFLPRDKERKHVNHIDGNRENNHVENLEWCTHTENMQHAAKNDMLNIITKPVENSKGEIFDSVRLASKAYSVTEACIGACARGEQKTSAGLTWNYV